jgi:hypothetical protein
MIMPTIIMPRGRTAVAGVCDPGGVGHGSSLDEANPVLGKTIAFQVRPHRGRLQPSAEVLGNIRGMREHTSPLRSAKGAEPCQPGATPQERRHPQPSGLKARAIRLVDGPGLQPSHRGADDTQGVALGWDGAGALPHKNQPVAALDAESADVLGNIRGMLG